MHRDTKMCIAPHTDPNLNEVVNTVSLKLNHYLNNMVHNGLHIVQMVKSSKPEDIKKRLDYLHIEQYSERMHSFKTVGNLLKKAPNHSDEVVFENFNIKEEVIYWNSEGNGILATIQLINSDEDDVDDVYTSNSITLIVNDSKDTEDTTLFCISKLLTPHNQKSVYVCRSSRNCTKPDVCFNRVVE